MPRDTEKTLEDLAATLFTFPFEDYLSSESFALFRREHDLDDNWKEYLQISRDKPELYGSAVIKNAFVLFLSHIFRSRPEEFPALITRLLIDFSLGISREFPVDDLKKDLRLLGYSAEEIDHAFSVQEEVRESRNQVTGCPR
jgi:hypothetical protein